MKCPVCGNDCWDNTAKKAAGAFKPTSPDRSCKDKSCGWCEWDEPKEVNHAKAAGFVKPAAAPRTSTGGLTPAVPKATGWDELHSLYGRALFEAEKVVPKELENRDDNLTRVAAAFAICAALKGLSGVNTPVNTPKPAGVGPAFDNAPLPDGPPDPDDDLPF